MELKFTIPEFIGEDKKYNDIVIKILIDVLHLSTRYLKNQDILKEDQLISIIADACSKNKYSISTNDVEKIIKFMSEKHMHIDDISHIICNVIAYKENKLKI